MNRHTHTHTHTHTQWGAKDPWIVPKKADYIIGVKPDAERIDLVSGHCPHDDTPDEVNTELIKWVNKIW